MKEFTVMREAIARFELNLEGTTVFTEAASGAFLWTPIIALLAGAREVLAITRDSRYGSALDVAETTLQVAKRLGLAHRLRLVEDKSCIGVADIVTNLGFVRPLDRETIQALQETAVVPLMWETWEHRPADLDLGACLDRGILVLGTQEAHPSLQFMDYVGLLAVKLLFEAGVEVRGSSVVLVGGGTFAAAALAPLLALGCRTRCVCPRAQMPPAFTHLWLDETLGGDAARAFLPGAEALLFMDHLQEGELLGEEADLDAPALAALNPALRIVHISGLIDGEGLRAADFHLHPPVIAAAPRTMSVTPAWLGPRPVIELHTAGLKVGETMARARRTFPRDPEAARRLALQNPLCQDFSPGQYHQAMLH